MVYFITGVTGTVVPVIIEELMRKDEDPHFYFAIRKDARGNGIKQRFESVVQSLDVDQASKQKLSERSKLVEIDVEAEKLGIDPKLYRELVANTDTSVLILGESGVGKELIARAIHHASDRKEQPFVNVNCAALPANLIESELFGHEKGAFTGAVGKKIGKFEVAHEGTIFLDEIGEVSEPIQIKLLQVIQERIFNRVGDHRERPFRGRVIAATNRPINRIQGKGLLRDDFFYRLCSDIIMVPPLRQRIKEDPGELDDLLALSIDRITGQPSAELIELTKKTINAELGTNYPWPGNVRELAQCVRRILLNRSYGNHQNQTYVNSKTYPTQLAKDMENGTVDAKNLLKGYCRYLHEKFGTYIEVARRTGLDTRTVKKYIDED